MGVEAQPDQCGVSESGCRESRTFLEAQLRAGQPWLVQARQDLVHTLTSAFILGQT